MSHAIISDVLRKEYFENLSPNSLNEFYVVNDEMINIEGSGCEEIVLEIQNVENDIQETNEHIHVESDSSKINEDVHIESDNIETIENTLMENDSLETNEANGTENDISETIENTDRSSQNNHIVRARNKLKLHECELCSKQFSSKGSLKRHMMMHSDKRPYKCHMCEKS